MKKKIIVIMLAAIVLVSAGFVLAEEEEKVQVPKRDPRAGRVGRTDRERPDIPAEQGQRMPRGAGMDRESMFKEQLQRRQADHDAAVGELKAILRTAEEEKATKTAEMLKKLIEKKENEYKKAQEQMEDRRKRMEEMMKQREEEMSKRREGAQDQAGERSRRTGDRTRPRQRQLEQEKTEEK